MRKLPGLILSKEFLCFVLIAAQFAAIILLCVLVPAFLPLWLAIAAAWSVALSTSVLLLTSRRSADFKCAWFAIFCALPIVAPLLYIICTVYGKKRCILEVNSSAEYTLSAAAAAVCGSGAAGYDRAEYYPDGTTFFNALFERIASAKSEVLLEFFIFSRGKIFERLIESLETAKSNGAVIKIIIDGLGSAFKIGGREKNRLKKLGELKTFHRIIPLPIARHNLRDHRKIAVIDGGEAYIGGINIADEYANISCNYGYWKDSAVYVGGEAAQVFRAMFYSVWDGESRVGVKGEGKYLCLPYCDSPPARSFCEDAYISKILSAKRRVHILTPYFCGGEKLMSALKFCAKSGVEVQIIIPHIPDKKYVYAVTRAFAKELSSSGVQFYEFMPGFMHSKCVICDGEVFLGSYNFDFRSMHLNYECGILFNGDMCERAERDFQDCFKLSAPLLHGKATPAKRLTRFFLKIFAPLI